MIGTCKLCLTENIELKESHIIPRHHFKNNYLLKSSDLTCDVINEETGQMELKPIKDTNFKDGWTEYLLCQNCDEVRIGKTLEDYGADIIYSKKLKSKKTIHQRDVVGIDFMFGDHREIGDIEYKIFKNYLLSILWRASVSKLYTFSNVKLNPEMEEELRLIIFNNAFTSDTKFLINIFEGLGLSHDEQRVLTKFKKKSNANDTYSYYLVIGKCIYVFTVNAVEVPVRHRIALYNHRLKENGSFNISYLPKEIFFKWVKSVRENLMQ